MQKDYCGESLLENHNNDLGSGTLLTMSDTQMEIQRKKIILGSIILQSRQMSSSLHQNVSSTGNTLSALTLSLAHLFLIC